MAIEQGVETLLATQQEQVGFLIDTGNSIDSKALAILAINVGFLIFIAQDSSQFFGWWRLIITLAPLALSLVFDVRAIWPRAYASVGADLQRHPEYLSMEKEALLLQLLANTEQAITRNSRLNVKRLRSCVISIILTALSTTAVFAILWI